MKRKLLVLLTVVALGFTACKKDEFNPHNYTPTVGHSIQTVQTAWGLPQSIGGTTYNDKGEQVVLHFYPSMRATITFVNGKISKIEWQSK